MPRLHQRHLILAALAAVVAASCGHADLSPPTPELFLPRHGMGRGAVMMAIVGGKLVVKQSCLYFVGGGGDMSLAIWPPDARATFLDGRVLVSDGRGHSVIEGEEAHFGGGYIDHAFAQELSGQLIPAACQVEQYLLINGLERIVVP